MSVRGYTIIMAAQNVVTKVKDCTAILGEDKTYSLNFRVLDEVTCHRRIPGEETVTLSKGRTFSMSYRSFMRQADDMLGEDVMLENPTAEEIANLLKKATIDVDFESYKKGDKYNDAEGKEQEYLRDGTNKIFKEITLRRNAKEEMLAERNAAKNRANKKAEAKDKIDSILDSIQERGLNVGDFSFNL